MKFLKINKKMENLSTSSHNYKMLADDEGLVVRNPCITCEYGCSEQKHRVTCIIYQDYLKARENCLAQKALDDAELNKFGKETGAICDRLNNKITELYEEIEQLKRKLEPKLEISKCEDKKT